MENFGNFLDKKYSDLAGSKPVERAAQKQGRQGENIPHLREERVDAYIDRLEDIIKDERGFGLLKYKVLEKYVTKPEDVSEKYWENQEAEERKMGKGADWDRAKGDSEMLAKFKQEHLETVLNDQRSSLEQWVDYFGSSDSEYVPSELKYWVFRSVLGMQELVKKKDGEREYIEFPKRSRGTVKPFPDINHEALAYVIDAVKTKYDGKGIEFEHDIQPDEREEFKKFLAKEDFSRLYGWANELMSTVPEHLLPITEGEWVKYEQGSDPVELVRTIRGKGTGWCTAGKNTAKTQLRGGDFYVYYTLDDDGNTTIPRLAIRMEGHDKIAESPRGIAYKQNLDPYMPPILESKLEEFGKVGEQYKKRAQDMEQLTTVEQKIKSEGPLTKDDLTFLYELNSPIEGFGYQKDPRIAELRAQRNPEEDMPVIFGCTREQIAHDQSEVNEGTLAYLGQWNPTVSQALRNYPRIKHLYESFPDKKIFMQTLDTDPTIQTPTQAEAKLKEKGIHITDWGKDILQKTEFSKEQKTYELVRFTVAQLGFPSGATIDEIYARANELGLDLCHAEVGPHLRLAYLGGEWMAIAMKQLPGRHGGPDVFHLDAGGAGLGLHASDAKPSRRWGAGYQVVFCSRKFGA